MPVTIGGSGPITGVTSINTTVSDTELGYLDGVSSALQTQIDGKWTTNTAWTAYTPTVTADTGTPTTVAAEGRYLQVGKIVFIYLQMTVTNKGTATGSMIFTLPVNRNASSKAMAISAVETTVIGGAGAGWFGSANPDNNKGLVRKYDWTTYWVNNYVVVVTGFYEAA